MENCTSCGGALIQMCPACTPEEMKPEAKESRYLDVRMTDEMVRGIITEQMALNEKQIREIVHEEMKGKFNEQRESNEKQE